MISGQTPKHDLGVLFVHGIGEQREGRTLAAFAGALYTWLFHWNSDRDRPRTWVPELFDTVLAPRGSGTGDEPAHATLRAALRLTDGTGYDRRWLLAESWWAKAFEPARFVDLARWLWKVSTCLLVLQFVIPMRRHGRLARGPVSRGGRVGHVLGVVVYAVLMGLAAPLSVLLSLSLFALAVASFLPIPRIDRAVQWIVVNLSSVLGDSYVLVRCPVAHSAMRTRVAADLDWLEQRCDKVVIVAHSQGAAIAHQVLADRRYRRDRLRAFVTVGQGISKLHLLDHLSWDARAARAAFWSRTLVVFGLALAGLPVLVSLVERWTAWSLPPSVSGWWSYLLGLACVGSGVWTAIHAVDKWVDEDVRLEGAGTDFAWIDYYASADPVSNGPLPPRDAADPTTARGPGDATPPGGTQPSRREMLPCRRVYNRASILTDHNAYLRNQDQFVTGLIGDLVAADLGPSASGKVAEPGVLEATKRRRHQLVSCLIAARIAVVGLASGLWWWDLTDSLREPATRMAGSIQLEVTANDGSIRVGAAALAALAVYLLVVVAWRWWERARIAKFFRGAAGRATLAGEREPLPPDREQAVSHA